MSNGNYAAFPIQANNEIGSLDAELGLTKREYFAAAALQGLLAGGAATRCSVSEIVGIAMDCADDLLSELARRAKP